MLNIYTLHYFYVTAQHLNFSRAAKHLYITQPALSKQIQQLEDQLQVKLFDRTKRSVKLTEAGFILLDHCRNIFQTIADLETAMDQFRKEIRGSLRVAATPSLGNYMLPDFLKEFSTVFPQIMMHTIFKPVDEVTYMLRTGELDFGLLNTDQDFDGLVSKKATRQELVFICSRKCWMGCKNINRTAIEPKDIESCRFILFGKISQNRKAIDAFTKDQGLTLNTVVESANIEFIKNMVIRGMGGAIVPGFTIRNELGNKLLTVKKLKGVKMERPVGLYYNKDLTITKAHEEFMSIFDIFCASKEAIPFKKEKRKKSGGKKKAVSA